MKLKLSDNIKKYRKEMELTQEGLADAIGVTVGAVSKWERGSNTPDIVTMMELANLFDISLDELVGYDMSSKKIEDMCARIESLGLEHRFDEAIKEAGDAILRYPHNFKVLHTYADIYLLKTMETLNPDDAEKGISLFNEALRHISQNNDPEINKYNIKTKIAHLYIEVDPEKALEHLKEINFNNNLCNEIALVLQHLGRTTEALDNFTLALIQNHSDQCLIVINFAWALIDTDKNCNLRKAIELLDIQLAICDAYSYQDKITYIYKNKLLLMISKACLYSLLDDQKEMKNCVKETQRMSKLFCSVNPPLDIEDFFKFNFSSEKHHPYDMYGNDANTGIDTFLQRKVDTMSGKKRECIQRVIDYWNNTKEVSAN
ncbi:MAG: helix-turn-helix transcriptional regulator [Butyrivibrio sp.]|nr:helix-turn-helix transcriptional regulator [Butyrivibrio sp.]